jgi:hypothetical protein
MKRGIIFSYGDKYLATVVEEGKILAVTEDIGGQPCPEGTRRYFKMNRGVWAECRKAAGTGRWVLVGQAIFFPNPTRT